MLAVVEEKQETAAVELINEVIDELVADATRRAVANANCGSDRADRFRRPVNGAEVTEPNAVGVALSQGWGEFERQPCLAGPTGTAQGHHSRDLERCGDCGDLAIATHEATGGDRKRVRPHRHTMLQDVTLKLGHRRVRC